MKKIYIKCDRCKSENVLNFADNTTEFHCHKCNKLLYSTKRKQLKTLTDKNACLICGESSPPLAVLRNYQKIHSKCLYDLENEISYHQQKKQHINNLIVQLKQRAELDKKDISKLSKKLKPNIIIKLFVNENKLEHTKSELLKKENNLKYIEELILKHEQSLVVLNTVELQKRLDTHNIILENIVEEKNIPRRWLSKGPKPIDPNSRWGQVRESVFKQRGRRCEKCLKDNNLHVHHIKEVRLGGTNEPENLIILCEACHSKEHGRSFVYDNDIDGNYGESKKASSKKVSQLNKAIKSNESVAIIYRKEDGTVTEREVKPIRIDRKYFGRIYLEAFCYLRNDKRTIRVSRIINIY